MTKVRNRISPYRMVSVAHRLEDSGFHLARQAFAPDLLDRARRDEALRRDLIPLREFLRPLVFDTAEARNSACQAQLLGGAIVLTPVKADELGVLLNSECLVGIGPRVVDQGFLVIAPTIVDPEVDRLAERAAGGAWDGTFGTPPAASTVVTVAGVHYQLLIDQWGESQVRAKCPFDAVDQSEIVSTATWLLGRMESRREDW